MGATVAIEARLWVDQQAGVSALGHEVFGRRQIVPNRLQGSGDDMGVNGGRGGGNKL